MQTREIGNAHNTHAVAVRNISDGDIKTVGYVPHKLSALRSIFCIVQSCVYR